MSRRPKRRISEQARAAFYQAHKDDPRIWGEAEKRRPPREDQRLSMRLTIRFTPDEADVIRGLAQERNVSYSHIIREAVGDALARLES